MELCRGEWDGLGVGEDGVGWEGEDEGEVLVVGELDVVVVGVWVVVVCGGV